MRIEIKDNILRREGRIHSSNKYYFTDKDYLDIEKTVFSERTYFGKDRTKCMRKKEVIAHSGDRYWHKPVRRNSEIDFRSSNMYLMGADV